MAGVDEFSNYYQRYWWWSYIVIILFILHEFWLHVNSDWQFMLLTQNMHLPGYLHMFGNTNKSLDQNVQ